MALSPRRHGVRMTEVSSGALTLAIIATSVWGIVAVAADADPDVFPLDTPVLVTDIDAVIADAGATGTLATSLRAIADQARAVGVVVRVAAGAGEDAEDIADDQNAKLIGAGAAGSRTGLQALLDAEGVTGVRPRILAVPGFNDDSVATALGVIAGKLGAIAYFQPGPVATVAASAAFRDAQSARELFLIHGDFMAFDTVEEEDAVSYATARAVGLRARLDAEVGYHKTISNVAVEGVTGIVAPVSWDPQSEDTEAGLLNGADITVLVRRNGYRFWGNRGCSDDPRFAFESAVRTNQVLRDTIADGVFPFIDKPLRPALARDIVETINKLFRQEQSAGRIIGAEAFLAEGNTSDQLAAGKLRIGYRFTPCAPLEDLGIASEITDEFYADFAQLAA